MTAAGPAPGGREAAGAQGQERTFLLVPFAPPPGGLELHLQGQLLLRGDQLQVSYALGGDLDTVVLPPPAPEGPRRRDGLWESTCFELFLAAEGALPYWEVNLAPSGDWNLYRLADYRQGLAPVADQESLPWRLRQEARRLELTLQLRLPRELLQAARGSSLRLGVTAVIQLQGGDQAGELTYWALHHGGGTADFHRRTDFRIRLEPPGLT